MAEEMGRSVAPQEYDFPHLVNMNKLTTFSVDCSVDGAWKPLLA
jgi:hypothetical protein